MPIPPRPTDYPRRVAALAGCVLLAVSSVRADEPLAPDCGNAVCTSRPDEQPNWADSSYRYVTSRGDTLAQWVDSFFYAPNTDVESADSVLRLVGEYQWDQEDGSEQKLRLRGKVDLPQLDRRLSLVFSEDADERRDVLPESELERSDVGLAYRVIERAQSLVYFSVGTNASLELRSSLRMRYDYPISENWHLRLSERLYYKEDDGFGTLTRTDLDYRLDENRIIRWTSDADYGEETDGTEWGTRLSYFVRLNDKEAVSVFGAVSGQTDPESYTGAYALGVRYRRNVFRPWVFVEFEPSHVWRKDEPWENRSTAWVVAARVEFREEIGNRLAARRAVRAAEH